MFAIPSGNRSSARDPGLDSPRRRRCDRVCAASRRKLVFEPLEARQLLAADLLARFEFADSGGTPVTSLQAGQDFLLRLYIQDVRSVPQGTFQAFFDVNYNASLVSAVGPITHGSAYNAAGTISGDLSVSGLIDEVGGQDTDQLRPSPRNAELLLFSIPCHASNPGTLNVTADLADRPDRIITFFDTVSALQLDRIAFSGGTVTILAAGIQVTPTSGLTTTESGGAATFSVVLGQAPTANVTIGLSSSDTTEGTVTPNSLTFTPANWNLAQQVTVTGVNDDVLDGPVGLTISTAPAVSSDAAYSGRDAADVSVTNTDDDATTVSILAADPTAAEPGSDDGQFTVRLDGGKLAPPGGITVNYSVSGTASAGSDYVSLGGTVLIPAGASSAAVVVDALNDQVIELAESVVVTLTSTNHAGATVHPTQNAATVTVNDDDATTVSVTASDDAGSEPGTNDGQFTVSLDGGKLAPPGGIVVSYSVTGSATPNADYAALAASVSIPAGSSSATLAVDVLNDHIVEQAETVVLALTGTNHAGVTTSAANATATVTVNDDDATTVSIAATDASGSETGANGVVFTVTLAGSKVAPVGGVVVDYAIAGTATAGADYAPLPGSVTIPAGASAATIAIAVTDDNLVEIPETIVLTLTGTGNGAVSVSAATSQATATLTDNDATTVSLAAADAAGGEPGSNDAQFTVTLDGGKAAPAGGIAVTYSVSGTASAGADYASLSGSVTIPAGASTATIAVDVLDDDTIEPTENLVLTLNGVSHAAVSVSTTGNTATVTLADDDATTVSVTPTDATGSEPGTDDGQFTVRLDGGKRAPTGGITVNYAVSGTASAGADYSSLSGSVTISAGASSATVFLSILNDSLVEGAETVVLTLTGTNHLSAVVHATDKAATITIGDDDGTTVSVAAADASGAEPGSDDAQFTVTLDGGKLAAAGGIIVSYTVSGTATGGSDYTTLPASVTIAAGSSSAVIVVDVLDDQIIEGSESLVVTLTGTNHAAAAIAANNLATVTIADDDATTVSIAATDGAASEPGGNDGLLTVTLAGSKLAPPGGIAVAYTVNGTATAGADYSSLSGTVTIPAGASSAAIAVDALDDQVIESQQTVVVTLSGTNHPGAAVHATNRTATVSIADDDATTLTVTVGDATAGEVGGDGGSFLLALNGNKLAPAAGLTVTYGVSGTAKPGTDYAALPGTVVIPAGQASVTISVSALDDQVIENAETVVLTLTAANHAAVSIDPANAVATVTVNDDDATSVSVVAADPAAGELGADDGQFLVSLNNGKTASAGGIQVAYTVNGTATPGTDYAALAGTVIIPAGQSSATITVDVVDDPIVEITESVSITLTSTNHPGVTVPATDNTATINVADNDATGVSIIATDASGGEPGANAGLLTIALADGKLAPAGGIAVSYSSNGSATAGTDYVALAGSVTIPGGSSSATIAVAVLDDSVVETTETLRVTLTGVSHPAVSLTPAAKEAEVTIADDDATTVSISATVADGSEAGLVDGQFTVTLDGGKLAPSGGVAVTYSVLGTAAASLDYAALSGTATIPAGQTSIAIPLDVFDDNLVELSETVSVTLTGSEHPAVTLSVIHRTATVTIASDDAAIVTLSGPQSADEGDAGTRLLTFTVTLSAPVDVPVSVDYATADGTAEDEDGDGDYESAAGTLTFAPGATLAQTIAVTVRGDTLLEPDETFQLGIGNLQAGTPARNVLLADEAATATIIDDDAARLTIVASRDAAEDTTDGLFTVTTDKLLSQPIQVLLSITGTATAGADYVVLDSMFTFPAHAASATIPLAVLPDNTIEGSETVVVRITGTSDPQARPGAPDSATLFIADDEATTVSVAAVAAATGEAGANEGRFRVVLAGGKLAPAQGITVTYSATGSALAGADYTALSGTVTIPAGQSSADIPIQVLDDQVVELSESISLTLLATDNPGVTIDTASSSAAVTIADDDQGTVSLVAISNGAEAATPVSGKFRVTQTRVSSTDTVLSFAVSGTATPGAAGDYVALSGAVTIVAGTTTADIDVAVLNDDLVEATETITVTLDSLTSAAPGIALDGADAAATISLADDDTAVVSLAKISDGAEGPTPAAGRFRVTQSRASSTDTVLSYSVGGTAAPGSGNDYTALGGTIMIAAGTLTADIDVAVLNDALVEGPETVTVTLASVTSGDPQVSLAASGLSATVVIADEDTATVSIAAANDGIEHPSPTSGKFRVTLSRASSTETVLSYTLGGTATPAAAGDYAPLSGSVTIAAGTTTAEIVVVVLNDPLVEGSETVSVTLSAVSSGNPGIAIDEFADAATLSISDDDSASVSIARLIDGAEAAAMHGKFRVTLSLASATDTVVSYSVSGTATPGAGADYVPLSGIVTIAAGTMSADIDVAVLDDDIVENAETVVATLTALTSAAPEISLNTASRSASLDILDDDTASVSIARAADGAEGDPPVPGRFRVTMTKPSDSATVVSYLVAGTAAPGADNDYLPLAGTVTIAGGATTADIIVVVQNDLLVELAETVIVTLSAVTGGDSDITIAPAAKTATVSILDEPARVSITASDPVGSEPGADQGLFTVALSGGRQAPPGGIQVSYTVSGSAASGLDYTALSGMATIPAGLSSVAVPVVVLNDNIVELPETVTVTLTGTDHSNVTADFAASQASVTINDDDATTVALTASDPSGSEPADGGLFTVTLNGDKVAPAGGIVVAYIVSGTATAGLDYTALPGTVTIPAGQAAATIRVDILPDNVVEVAETVSVTLTGTSEAGVTVEPAAATALVTLNDGSGVTTVSVVATDATGSEPGTNDGLFTVSLSGGRLAPEGGITVSYSVSGTATPAADYTAHTGTVSIPGGQSSALIPVDVLDDSLLELSETVIVTLTGTNHPGVAVAPTDNSATVTIADDDLSTVSITATDASGSEPGADEGLLTVTLAGGKVAPAGGLTVSYSVSGSATGGIDYAVLSGTVTISAGGSSATLSIDVLDDAFVELPETVVVTLINTDHAGVTVGTSNNAATVSIQDDDPTTVSITASDAGASEPGSDDGAFTVTLDGGKLAPTGGITVTYTIAGTATAGADYTSLTGTVTIPAGQSSAVVPVDVLDDNFVEVPETVAVTLTGTNHAAATLHATNKSATVTIASADDNTTVSVAAGDATGREPGTDEAQFTVALAGGKLAPTGGLVVNFTTAGTASAGSDFTALSGSVTIPAGAASATIALDVLDDNVVESTETVVVTLTGTSHAGATIATAGTAATANIEDDDATTVSIAASDATGGEPADDGQFTVTLVNSKVAPPGGIVVSYTAAGTATSGSDYTALSGSVTIPAGASSAMLPVDVIADAIADEAAETVVVTLTSANHPSVTVSTSSPTATVTIAADDLKNASISGFVWIDANNDRQQQQPTGGNPLEPGIPGVIVRLTGTARDGTALDLVAMTDDDGGFKFKDLPAGTYEVHEEQPTAWIDGQEMLASSTVNDTYSNIALTPGQQAVNYSFGERTLQPQFISKRHFLASTPVTEVYLRQVNALAEQRAGDADGAQAIRDASIPSEVSPPANASSRLTSDAALDEPSDAAADESSLAAGESSPSAPSAPEPVVGGEGEVASAPVRAAASNIAPSPSAPASSVPLFRPAVRSAPHSMSAIAGLPVSPTETRLESAPRPAEVVIGRSSDGTRPEATPPAVTLQQDSDRPGTPRRRPADEKSALEDLVDQVFATDAWLNSSSAWNE